MDCTSAVQCHDYCSKPEPSALDLSISKNEELSNEIKDLKLKLKEIASKFWSKMVCRLRRVHPIVHTVSVIHLI
ncbi:UNVERIFIED_CONTAM: hypothetical protein FKN15_000595 [Acipenser sinensis]